MLPLYISAAALVVGLVVGFAYGLRVGDKRGRGRFVDDMIRNAFRARERSGIDVLQ